MVDEKFIKELKESALRKKLPTVEDLGSSYRLPFKEPIEEKVEENKEKIEEKARVPILERVRELYSKESSLDEIYRTLSDEGYSYEDIEDAILKVTKEENKKEELPREEKKISEIGEIERKLGFDKEDKLLLEKRFEYAPLFIKIEKYNETLENLENLENYLKAMSRLFDLINELERIRRMNIEALTKLYHKVMATASKLYSGLLKPKGMKFEGSLVSEAEMEKLDSVIRDLNKELNALRLEIEKLKGLE